MTVVFLHGAHGAAADWQTIQHQVLNTTAFDLPGHGDALDGGDLAIDVDDLFTVALDRLAEQLSRVKGPITLVGYSLGARLALATTLLRAVWCEQVERLVLVSATAGIDDAQQPGERDRRCAVDDERAAALANDPATFLSDFWRLPLFADLQQHPQMPDWLAQRQRRALAFTSTRAHWQRGLSVARMPSLWSRVTELRNDIRVDVIVGSADAPYLDAAQRLCALLAPRAQLHGVDGVGHALPLLAPQAIVDVINHSARA